MTRADADVLQAGQYADGGWRLPPSPLANP